MVVRRPHNTPNCAPRTSGCGRRYMESTYVVVREIRDGGEWITPPALISVQSNDPTALQEWIDARPALRTIRYTIQEVQP